ncbi:hypothetical protein HPX80_002181 [Salmonella enterica]|nr:hypothetical protein [Salmonella enterica]
MKLKTVDIEGTTYAETENGHPVYVHSDGKEVPFDAPTAMNKISELNGEAKKYREGKEAAEAALQKFAGIDDPVKATEALETVKKIDQKALIDAGEVDRVKEEITRGFQGKLDEATRQNEKLQEQLYREMIGGRFNSSVFIRQKLAIPADFVQARFGQSFRIEEGKVVAYDGQGNKIYSRQKPGDLADFDEALETLVDHYPQKDHILKASGNNGGDSRTTQYQQGQKTLKRSAFDQMDTTERMAAMKDGVTIID